MTFKILDRLDEEFPTFAFGTNKDGDVFVKGNNTGLKVEGATEDEAYNNLKEILLKKKLIKYVPTE